MRAETIARNYAEALFDLAEKSGQVERYGELIDAVALAIDATPEVQAVLMSPRVPKAEKSMLLARGLQGTPRPFVLFLQAVVKRNRQRLFREIAAEYLKLLDEKLNRVRAGVILARVPDEKLRQEIADTLSRELGKQVIAHINVDPEILGGSIVRIGDRVHDGSLRRRLARLRQQLLAR